jgi:hypothetical protein
MRHLRWMLLALIYTSTASFVMGDLRPEGLPEVLYRPAFLSADSSFTAGLAYTFRLKPEGRCYLVTCHSLFGKISGFETQLTPLQLAMLLKGAIGISVAHPQSWIVAQPYLMFPDATPFKQNDARNDIAAFAVKDTSHLTALLPARELPKKGERIFLLTKSLEDGSLHLMAAEVTATSPQALKYRFLDSQADVQMINGAPILSSQGQLVGMHVAVSQTKLGTLYGLASPVTAICAALEEYETIHARPVEPMTPATTTLGNLPTFMPTPNALPKTRE